ncbi:MAG: hypothetical protein M3443_17030 [Actinomycetota bacterium]|nr:hypothetical protein [Actinomycetota bacterium]
MIAAFNPFMVAESGGAGDLVPDWMENVVFDIDRPNGMSLAVVELRTGLAVDRSWFPPTASRTPTDC